MRSGILLFTIMVISSLTLNAQTIMNIHQSNGTVLQIPLNTIDSITYTITNPGNLATISTLPISNITVTTATSGGNITSNGGTPVTQRGVVWGTGPSPTTANNSTTNGNGSGSFTSNLINLTANTIYYVRAYATNSAGTAYGNELSFITTAGGGGIVSNPGAGVTFDGYTYTSIVLGNGQEWMSENLRTKVYANGDSIPNIVDSIQWQNLNTGAWAHNDNDSQYDNPYGKIYNWYTVVDTRNLCPSGWHVPSDADWDSFIQYLDPLSCGGNCFNTAGSKMKSTDTQYWPILNTDATNESGFSALPCSVRNPGGTFEGLGYYGYYWSTAEYGIDAAWSRRMDCSSVSADDQDFYKASGCAVRCLRD